MSLSYSENTTLICPACGQSFAAEVWLLVDAAERPDLADALREGTLNVAACPHCSNRSLADVALLFHDAAGRRVYFAAPPEAAEYELREQAQSLLYRLMAGMPEEAHLPYLGDVQVEQGLEGVRRALLRRQRARRAPAAAAQPPVSPAPARGAEHHVVDLPPESQPAPAPLFDALEALLAADSPAEFAALVDEHPALLGAAADATLAQQAEVAQAHGDLALATALRQARAQLARMRGARTESRESRTENQDGRAGLAAEQRGVLSAVAYQTLLTVASVDELRAALGDYPSLLEEWADDELLMRVESALEAGDERLAADIEERREALAALREELSGTATLPQAIKALLAADGEDALTAVLGEHPILLTGTAQDALAQLAADARQRGDSELADYAEQRRAMLRKVRAGLEAA